MQESLPAVGESACNIGTHSLPETDSNESALPEMAQ